MKPILVSDREAVSPVIATILLVAITVILAAVLYVVAMGIFSSHSAPADFLGVSLDSSSGVDWVLTFVSVTGTPSQNGTFLMLKAGNGTTELQATLFQLETPVKGVRYIPAQSARDVLSVGDQVRMPLATYPSGTLYDFATSESVLAAGVLHY